MSVVNYYLSRPTEPAWSFLLPRCPQAGPLATVHHASVFLASFQIPKLRETALSWRLHLLWLPACRLFPPSSPNSPAYSGYDLETTFLCVDLLNIWFHTGCPLHRGNDCLYSLVPPTATGRPGCPEYSVNIGCGHQIRNWQMNGLSKIVFTKPVSI